jgi:hypothetical protein
MNLRIEALHAPLDLNTRLFVNAPAGVDDTVATRRPSSDTNAYLRHCFALPPLDWR